MSFRFVEAMTDPSVEIARGIGELHLGNSSTMYRSLFSIVPILSIKNQECPYNNRPLVRWSVLPVTTRTPRTPKPFSQQRSTRACKIGLLASLHFAIDHREMVLTIWVRAEPLSCTKFIEGTGRGARRGLRMVLCWLLPRTVITSLL